MNYNDKDLYAGDLSRIADQFTRGTWAGTDIAQRKWPKGIPGQASIVTLIGRVKLPKRKAIGFLTTYGAGIKRHRELLVRRARHRLPNESLKNYVLAAENLPPTGQTYGWYQEVIHYVPLSGMLVAKQIARLCGDDSQVTIPQRSLAEAVGRKDRLNRERAYMERGVQSLVDAGWLTVEVIAQGADSTTTYYLQVGDHSAEARRTLQSTYEDYGSTTENE